MDIGHGQYMAFTFYILSCYTYEISRDFEISPSKTAHDSAMAAPREIIHPPFENAIDALQTQ